MDIQVQQNIDAAFNNPLVVEDICSFTSEADLLSCRLVNRLFHYQATRRFRDVQHKVPIVLMKESSAAEFISRMQNRIDIEDGSSFPFSAFKINPHNSIEAMESLVAETGKHIRRVKFQYIMGSDPTYARSHEFKNKLILLLSRASNLEEVKLTISGSIQVTSSDLTTLPETFPKLRIIGLVDVNEGIQEDEPEIPDPPDAVPLLSVLIARSPRLHKFGPIVWENEHRASLVRTLLEHHNNAQLPLISPLTLRVLQANIPLIRELQNLNLRVSKLTVTFFLYLHRFGPTPILRLLLWLATQASSLETLRLCFILPKTEDERQIILPLPNPNLQFEALKVLTVFLSFSNPSENDNTTVWRLHLPLALNQFPVLRTVFLSVSCLRSVLTFDNPLASVQELWVFYTIYSMETASWHRLLPNLTSMKISEGGDSIFNKPILVYILTHFPHLIVLEIKYHSASPGQDNWGVLTGDALRPDSRDILLRGALHYSTSSMEEPINGVYQVPSLRNLQELQVLTIRSRNYSNLDAILYMTRVGYLVPLKKLSIITITHPEPPIMEVEEKQAYQEILAQFHTNVSIVHEVYVPPSVPVPNPNLD